MAKSNLILTVTPETAKTLALTKEFSAVNVWDNAQGMFTDEQQTNDNGLPIWESVALMAVGWGEQVESVRIRIVSPSKPDVRPSRAKLVEVLTAGMAADGANSGSVAPTPTPRMSAPQPRSGRP